MEVRKVHRRRARARAEREERREKVAWQSQQLPSVIGLAEFMALYLLVVYPVVTMTLDTSERSHDTSKR